jgi:tetratricopeptide (TPR) repeat protein
MFVWALGASPVPQTAVSPMETQARAALEAGDFARALPLLKDMSRRRPNDRGLQRDLAVALEGVGKWVEALQQLDRILKSDPADEQSAVMAAIIQARRQRWPQVIELLDPFGERTTRYETSHMLAEAHRHRDLLLDASWHYMRAVQHRPEAVEDHIRLGQIHLQRNLPALAIRSLSTALQLGARDVDVHAFMARALQKAGRALGHVEVRPLAGAIVESIHDEYYIIEAVPDEPNRYLVASSNSAIYHAQLARELAMKLNEEPEGLDKLLADVWFDAGYFDRAQEIYEAIEGQVPSDDRAAYHYRYSMTLFEMGDLDAHLRHFARAAELDPDTYEAQLGPVHERLAKRYCLLGNLKRYIDFLEKAIVSFPRRADLHYRLGNAFNEAGRPDDARKQWLIVLQLDPHHPDRDGLLQRVNTPDAALNAGR